MSREINKRVEKFIKLIGLVIMIGLFIQINGRTVEAAKFKLSKTEVNVTKGTTYTLKAKNLPSANAKVTWSTSNKFAATVSKDGKVSALNYGVTVITATCNKKTATCRIVIPDLSSKVTLNVTELNMTTNTDYQLTATATSTVSYHSQNNLVATVDDKGLVHAVNPGVVYITAKTKTGVARCKVSVVQEEKKVKMPAKHKKRVAIRRITKKKHFVYEPITWKANKSITFKIANLDETQIKKCKWSSSNKAILSKPVKSANSKIEATAKTLKKGKAQITAKVKYKNGSTVVYTSKVYVSEPKLNTKQLTLLGSRIAAGREQFVSFTGLTKYSKIKWSNSDTKLASITECGKSKIAVKGLNPGSGTIKAEVDGKKYKIKYTVQNPTIATPPTLMQVGKKFTIKITGADAFAPIFTSRNTEVATVSASGKIKAKKAGITYIDIQMGETTFSYRIEVVAKGIPTIISRAQYIVDHWTYSQAKRMKDGYYDCSALVYKGYQAYKDYHKKLTNVDGALSSGDLFDFLYSKGQIKYFGYIGTEVMQPGDLIFYGDYENACKYSTPGRTLNIYHVSMYAGNGKVVEKGGQTINYNNTKYIVGIGRVVE